MNGKELPQKPTPVHTSALLEKLVARAPDEDVNLDWLLEHLDKRSFGLLLLLLGLLVILPGIATIATVAIIFPSVEMIVGRNRPTFPRFISRRKFDFERFKRFATMVSPTLRVIEHLSRPRWAVPHAVARRLVGFLVLLLALSALWPLPLVNIIPGAVIVFLAIAYLQDDGFLLAAASLATLCSLAGFAWTAWKSIDVATAWIGRFWHWIP